MNPASPRNRPLDPPAVPQLAAEPNNQESTVTEIELRLDQIQITVNQLARNVLQHQATIAAQQTTINALQAQLGMPPAAPLAVQVAPANVNPLINPVAQQVIQNQRAKDISFQGELIAGNWRWAPEYNEKEGISQQVVQREIKNAADQTVKLKKIIAYYIGSSWAASRAIAPLPSGWVLTFEKDESLMSTDYMTPFMQTYSLQITHRRITIATRYGSVTPSYGSNCYSTSLKSHGKAMTPDGPAQAVRYFWRIF